MYYATRGLALAAALLLAGCGGGGSSASPTTAPTGTSGTTQSQSENAIAATNAVGEPMKTLTTFNSASSPQAEARTTQSLALNTCDPNSGGGSYEFFSPDKSNDPSSTEAVYYYDNACTQPARDVVRIWSSTGASSETVAETVTIFASGNATASATRTDTIKLANASFDQYGYPVPAAGFERIATGNLAVAGGNTVNADVELVMLPGTAASGSFCGDAAGYNATGIAALGETFGWQAVISTGTRTVNADGSVTWTATHAGATAKGTIGALSIATGSPNTGCPIATPMFALAGGTSGGSYSIPTVATYKGGLLIGLTITNASLANGTTLNVTTNTSVSPTSNLFISGTIANGGTGGATFSVNAFGDGTLTMRAAGTPYVITDWHVVR